MLSKPKHGWTTVTVDGRTLGSASYCTDVPNDTLTAFIKYFKKGRPINIVYDGEGTEFGLVTFDDQLYAIYIDDNGLPTINEIDATVKDLALEVIDDIRSNPRAWAEWNYIPDEDSVSKIIATINERWIRLSAKCYTLEELCKYG